MATTDLLLRSCDHCGLPVPPSLVSRSGPSFCCVGCKTVFELLAAADLGQYYAQRTEPSGKAVNLQPKGEFSRLDDPEFLARAVRQLPDGSCSVELGIEGLHCAACVWLLERLPRLEPSVLDARVDLSQRTLALHFRSEPTELSALAARLHTLGYTASQLVAGHARDAMRRERRKLITRIGVAAASAGNAMLMAFALYSGEFGDGARSMTFGYRRLFEIGGLLVSLPALWASLIFFRGAVAALRLRTVHMDLPIALGITVAYGYGLFGVIQSGHDLYFDSITTLIFLLLVGRYLQNKHQSAHADALELASTVTPATARRVLGPDATIGAGVTVPTAQLVPGDYVEVLAGEAIPVDGRVRSGQSELDLSLLSGESAPVAVQPGDSVFAGGTNQTRRLVIQVERKSADSRAAQLMQSVEHALRTRAPLLQTIDRLAAPFTLVLIALAGAVGVLSGVQFGVDEGLRRALAILVIACPCALSMATPLALNAAIGKAARLRMLIKGTSTVEALGSPSLLVFDKTGTLTEGKLRVISFNGTPRVAELVAQAERGSNHPVAKALSHGIVHCRDLKTSPNAVESDLVVETVLEHPGAGLQVKTAEGAYFIGSERFLQTQGISISSGDLAEPAARSHSSLSPVLVGHLGALVGVAWLDDPIRDDARKSLQQLKELGHRLAILSGDHPEAVRRVRDALDPEHRLFEFAIGAASPEEKLQHIEALSLKGCTVMIGDGVNDAAALAKAHVGVAVSGAAEASMLSADVYLANAGVEGIAELFQGARRALNTVRRGLWISLAYNLLSVGLAATGVIGPLWAAILMPLSSVSVVTNAYRSRTFSRVNSSAKVRFQTKTAPTGPQLGASA